MKRKNHRTEIAQHYVGTRTENLAEHALVLTLAVLVVVAFTSLLGSHIRLSYAHIYGALAEYLP